MVLQIDKQGKLGNFILMLLMTIFSADTLIIGTNGSNFISKIANYSPMLIFFILLAIFVFRNQKLLVNKRLVVALLMSVNVCLTWFIQSHGDETDSYVIALFLILGAYLLTCIMDFNDFIDAFEQVVYFLSVWSLICLLMNLVLPSLVNAMPVITNKAGIHFHNLLFAVIQSSSSLVRNFGCFREPGVFQIYVNIAIAIHILKNQKPDIKRIIIYIITVVTTFSTTGYFTLLFLLIALTLEKREFSKKVRMLLILALGIVVFLAYTGYSDTIMYLINKPFNSTDTSGLVRTASIVCNFELWKSHPILGLGHLQAQTSYQTLATAFAGRLISDNANTTMYFFACYGLLVGILISVGTYGFCKKLSGKTFQGLLFLIAFLMLYSGENLYRSIFPYMFAMYGFIYFEEKKLSSVSGIQRDDEIYRLKREV